MDIVLNLRYVIEDCYESRLQRRLSPATSLFKAVLELLRQNSWISNIPPSQNRIPNLPLHRV